MPFAPEYAAGSRMTVERDIDICGWCGTDEAERDAYGLPPVPPQQWPVTWMLVGWRLYGHAADVCLSPGIAQSLLDSDERARQRRCSCPCVGCKSCLSHCSQPGTACMESPAVS